MKKIIYMISTLFYPSIGGVENHIYNLSKTLIENNKDIKVKVLKPTLNLEKNNIYVLDGIEVHEIAIGNKKDIIKYENYKRKSKGNIFGFFYGYKRKAFFNKYADFLEKYIESDIRSEKKDFIIHQHDFISSIILSKKLSKKYKIIFTNHTGEYLFLKKIPIINDIIIKFLTNHFSYIIGPSNELATFEKIRKRNEFCYLPNGVDTVRFNQINIFEKNKLRKELEIDENEIVVFSPRRWAPTKGIIYLVKAINELRNNERLKFYFAGNDYMDYPEYKKEILEYIENNNLRNNIKFLGNVDYQMIDRYYKVSDVVVLPSLMEAVSLGALEAMACGKIMIGTTVGGFPQIINSNKNGILVKPKNVNQLAEVLENISKELDNYSNLGKEARKFVEKEYSWEKISEKTLEIYNNNINIFGEIE